MDRGQPHRSDPEASMARIPRLLIASVSDSHEPAQCTLGLLAAFKAVHAHVQHFRSLAAFTPLDHVTPVTGIASRHLDAWMMSPDLCRELFVHCARDAEISVIEGSPSGRADCSGWPQIAQLLDCPVIGVISSDPVDPFHAPPLPNHVDALFIDQFVSKQQFQAQKQALEQIYRKPVVGGFAAGEPATEWIDRMQRGRALPGSAIELLAKRVREVTDLQQLMTLARSRPLSVRPPEFLVTRANRRKTRVAVAYDDCFHCYFPETLDALEFLGADVCQFSPLADERLPEPCDIVFLGCGHPEQYGSALAENQCMRAALCQHLCAGYRIYAEGGGAAYLCQRLRVGDSSVPMIGLLSADAEFTGSASPRPQRVEMTCQRSSWLAEQGDIVRGYRSGAWRFYPQTELPACFASDADFPEILVRHHCVASTIHVNFAAQPRVLASFFAAHAPSLSI
jgi:cobyrinic acid a,c-diamide synthase